MPGGIPATLEQRLPTGGKWLLKETGFVRFIDVHFCQYRFQYCSLKARDAMNRRLYNWYICYPLTNNSQYKFAFIHSLVGCDIIN
jgi:hypothetical protein